MRLLLSGERLLCRELMIEHSARRFRGVESGPRPLFKTGMQSRGAGVARQDEKRYMLLHRELPELLALRSPQERPIDDHIEASSQRGLGTLPELSVQAIGHGCGVELLSYP